MRRLIGLLRMYVFRLRGMPASGRPNLVGCNPVIRIEGKAVGGRNLWIRAEQFPVQITVRRNATLELGDDVFINQGVNILCAANVRIGDYCKIGDLAAIRDSDTHRISPCVDVMTAPVSIKRNVWIGRSVIIMPGVTIGENSVVGAGAVVTKDVPRNTVVAGVPARIISSFPEPEENWIRD